MIPKCILVRCRGNACALAPMSWRTLRRMRCPKRDGSRTIGREGIAFRAMRARCPSEMLRTSCGDNARMTSVAHVPAFTPEAAAVLARELYDLETPLMVTALPSERDQNFKVRCADGSRAVLKIANVYESRALLEAGKRRAAPSGRHRVDPGLAPDPRRRRYGPARRALGAIDLLDRWRAARPGQASDAGAAAKPGPCAGRA